MNGQNLKKPTLEDVKRAKKRIEKQIQIQAPIVHNILLNQKYDSPIYLKSEGSQITGSFKIRGATNKLLHNFENGKKDGVVTASAGNHAMGLSYIGWKLGIPVHVVMPKNAPKTKIETCRNLGATVQLHGEYYDDAYEEAKRFNEEKGYQYVHPVADCEIVAGQGTIGLEILESNPNVDQIVVPIGGGGLISGIALAVKSIKPSVKIIGVQSEQSCAYYQSIKEGKLVFIKEAKTIADGMSLKKPDQYLFDLIEKWVDKIILVKEESIKEAMKELLFLGKIVTEGAGAASFASLIEKKINLTNDTVFITSGSNIDRSTLEEILQE